MSESKAPIYPSVPPESLPGAYPVGQQPETVGRGVDNFAVTPSYDQVTGGAGAYPYNFSNQQPFQTGVGTMPVVAPAAGVPYRFDANPMLMVCPHCQQQITTETDETAGCYAWGISTICVLSCCFLGCCLIPFLHRAFKDIEHKCPQCKTTVGVYKRVKC